MESIIHKNKSRCFLCKQNENSDHLDLHHVFGGANRDKSEKYGITIYLHHDKCHIFGINAVHKNADICRRIQAYAQAKAMKHYGWNEEDFIRIFGKNYIQE